MMAVLKADDLLLLTLAKIFKDAILYQTIWRPRELLTFITAYVEGQPELVTI